MRVIEINLNNLKDNVRAIKAKAGTRLLAVVKADAYGHGLVECAKAAIEAGADYLGVALLEEAITLRDSGITAPIIAWLIPPGSNFALAIEKDIELGISSINVFREAKGAKIHLEVDTGMTRGGFLDEWQPLLEEEDLSNVVGIFTHFANADQPESMKNIEQRKLFDLAVAQLEAKGVKPIRHIANSSDVLANEENKYDMVRSGITLYGLSPSPKVFGSGRELGLKPVMKVKAQLVLVKKVPANTAVGYGATEFTKEDTYVGIVEMGYADGIPRIARDAGVTFNGKAAPIIGRVSMDQFTVNLGADTDAKSGDLVTVIGEEFDADKWGSASGSINYEIVTRISPRIKRVYVSN